MSMATQVIMPRVGISVESCIITKWHKQTGDSVKVGDALFSYETDKATAEEEAKTDGVILEIYAREGDEVPVLQTVCVIGKPGEESGIRNQESGAREEDAPALPVPPLTPIPSPLIPVPRQPLPEPPTLTPNSSLPTPVSPRAKRLAEKLGIAPHGLRGTGPGGRIIERDVRAASENRIGSGLGGRITVRDQEAGAGNQEGVEIVRLSAVRRAIAKSMMKSLSAMAQLTNHHSFDASAILRYRKALKAEADPALAGITLNDMILCAAARTLKNHRALNAHLLDEHMHYYSGVHLGIAVDTPRGLLVPTLFHADRLSLAELSIAAKQLIQEAQSGAISPDLLTGATFTVTNLGTLGVEQFTPVINPPQTGILGVCAIVDRIRQADGTIMAYPAMGLSLTYDHRAVDGAPAARFITELKENLEDFTNFLARQGE